MPLPATARQAMISRSWASMTKAPRTISLCGANGAMRSCLQSVVESVTFKPQRMMDGAMKVLYIFATLLAIAAGGSAYPLPVAAGPCNPQIQEC